MSAPTQHIAAGFIPLLDAAMLIVAREKGFAEEQGIDLELVRETSWASIRDRVAIGHFDAAHMLAPMAIAGSLQLPPLPVPFIAPVALGTGRNAITISDRVRDMLDIPADQPAQDAASAVQALATMKRDRMPGEPLVFGAVHAYSAHAYLLRYWLGAGGLFVGEDVRLEFVPPPFMADALASGVIDGCCVGEPWNSVAAQAGTGHVLVSGDNIWPGGPDKVLGLRADWAADNEDLVLRLVRALVAAADWTDDPDNADDLAAVLAAPDYLDTSADILRTGLTGPLSSASAGFARGGACIPQPAHAAWFTAQMMRWKEIEYSSQTLDKAMATYRPDLYARATGDTALPGSGAATLFDGRDFDPGAVGAYLEQMTSA